MIKRSTTFCCTKVSCSRSHHSFPQTLSLLLSAILSLLKSHNSGHIKLLDHHRKIPLLLTSKPQMVLIAFDRVSGWNKAAKASATRSFKTSILFPQPSTANGQYNHRHRNPLTEIYQKLPLLVRNLAEEFHPLQ
jgi:hypothetical protein